MGSPRVRPVVEAAVSLLRALPGGGAPFALAGGTGLAVYLDHRDSNDLDLFCPPGDFDGSFTIVSHWKKSMRIEPEFENLEAGNGRISRYRVTHASIRTKVDFVEDPWKLMSEPETLRGVRVMGIDDIYVRKIFIGLSREGYRPRDPLDLHALDREHHPLGKRISSWLNQRTVRAAYMSCRRLRPRDVRAAIVETRYGFDAAAVLGRVLGEFERAILSLETGEGGAR